MYFCCGCRRARTSAINGWLSCLLYTSGTTLLIQALTPGIIQAGYSVEQQREVFEFVASSDYFSGPTWMAMCKAAMDAAHGIEYSTCLLYTSRCV